MSVFPGDIFPDDILPDDIIPWPEPPEEGALGVGAYRHVAPTPNQRRNQQLSLKSLDLIYKAAEGGRRRR